jgi:hypothetical protein
MTCDPIHFGRVLFPLFVSCTVLGKDNHILEGHILAEPIPLICLGTQHAAMFSMVDGLYSPHFLICVIRREQEGLLTWGLRTKCTSFMNALASGG